MTRWLVALALVTRAAFAQVPAVDAGLAPDAGDSNAAPDAGAAASPESSTSAAALPPAEPISFKAALEKAEVTLGEPFHMTIEVRHPAKDTYQLPSDLQLKDMEIREHSSEEHGQDPKTTLFRLTLQSFKLGDVEIPAIHLLAQTPDGDRQLEIPPQKLKVIGVIDISQGQPQMREDLRPLPTRYRQLWWPYVIALCALAGFGTAWYLMKRARRPPPPPPPKIRPSPYDEALQRLRELQGQNLVATARKQDYYFRLSEIIRDYLGRVYTFDALELTSDELLNELRKRMTPGLDFDRLAAFLRESDMVKFAKSQASDGECKAAMDQGRAFINQTRPVEAPAAAGRTA